MEIIFLFLLILFFLSWGSFLNVVAYRLAFDKPFFTKRSYCPKCTEMIAWYDNIPVVSWILLRGKCRVCKKPISLIYPGIELLTAVVMTGLFFKIKNQLMMHDLGETTIISNCNWLFWSYFIFFTGLIVSTAMDFQALVVSQLCTLWLIPVGFLVSFLEITPLAWTDSLLGAFFGYGILWVVGFVFKKVTGKEGMGIGDMELLAMIGSFAGPWGVWASLMVGSILGVLYGAMYLMITKKGRETRIPFGPFLSFGAILYILFQATFMRFFG
ncbi:MAG: prepilin peptidase [bacterium]